MRTLVAMPKTEALDHLWAYQTEAVQVEMVYTKEQFFFRLEEQFDAIAVHCQLFFDVYPWDWLGAITYKQPDADVTIMLDATVYDSLLLEVITRLAADYDFRIIGVAENDLQLIHALAASLFGKASLSSLEGIHAGKIVAVWSAASKDGSTTIAVNTAIALAAKTKLRIGLIDGNLKNPEIRSCLNLTYSEKSNIRLRPKLQTNHLLPHELLDACTTFRKLTRLHILPGTSRRETSTDVTPEMIQHLLQVARRTFDITIIDVNNYPDNAATICSVRGADIKWLVAQDNYASYRTSWSEWFDCYWKYCGISSNDISILLNRTTLQTNSDTIAEIVRMPVVSEIPNVGGGLGIKASHEGNPLYLQYGTEAFKAKIDGLAGLLAGEKAMTASAKQPGQKGIWSRIVATLS